MFPGRRARVLQGFFRLDGTSRTPAPGPAAAQAAPARPAIVQRAPRSELLPGLPTGAPGRGVQRARDWPPATAGRPAAPGLPRATAGAAPVQRAAPRPANDARTGVRATLLPPGHLPVTGRGQPLPDAVRRTMEAAFNADFSAVRVHHGSAARNLGALAFTTGDDVHFAPGQYDPHTRRGLELLGHELAHVVQQRAGRVVNPFGDGVAVVQDPRLEREADDMARRAGAQMWQGRATPPATTRAARARDASAPAAARGLAAQPSMEESTKTIDIVLTPVPSLKGKASPEMLPGMGTPRPGILGSETSAAGTSTRNRNGFPQKPGLQSRRPKTRRSASIQPRAAQCSKRNPNESGGKKWILTDDDLSDFGPPDEDEIVPTVSSMGDLRFTGPQLLDLGPPKQKGLCTDVTDDWYEMFVLCGQTTSSKLRSMAEYMEERCTFAGRKLRVLILSDPSPDEVTTYGNKVVALYPSYQKLSTCVTKLHATAWISGKVNKLLHARKLRLHEESYFESPLVSTVPHIDDSYVYWDANSRLPLSMADYDLIIMRHGICFCYNSQACCGIRTHQQGVKFLTEIIKVLSHRADSTIFLSCNRTSQKDCMSRTFWDRAVDLLKQQRRYLLKTVYIRLVIAENTFLGIQITRVPPLTTSRKNLRESYDRLLRGLSSD